MHGNTWIITQLATSAITLLVAAPTLGASSAKQDYELQRTCRQQAQDWFTSVYGNGNITEQYGQTLYQFQNHYNAKLNKCVVLVKFEVIRTKTFHGETLMYLNEHAIIGSYDGTSSPTVGTLECNLKQTKCASKEQWDGLIDPYLED